MNLSKSSNRPLSQSFARPQSRPIVVGGVLLGTAIEHQLGVKFIATDDRVREMDQSVWPNVGYAHRSARQLFKSTITANQG
jgi:hypothetical protein